MKTKRATLLAVALMFCSNANALELIVSTYSWHDEDRAAASAKVGPPVEDATPATRRKNSETFGAGLAYELAPHTRVIAGMYRNSAWRNSRYVVLSRQIYPHVSLAAGYLDGYQRTPLGAAVVFELGPARLVAAPEVLSLWFAVPLNGRK